MGRAGRLFSTPEKQRQYQMIRFDRLPKAVRDKVNYADMQYYVTADGRLTVGTPGGAKAHQSRTGRSPPEGCRGG
jgi:hypothetical protein